MHLAPRSTVSPRLRRLAQAPPRTPGLGYVSAGQLLWREALDEPDCDEDRPTRPEQITIVTAPPQLIQAGGRLMEERRAEDQHLRERVGERSQRPRRFWPGVLVAVLVGLLLGAVMVATCWGAG